MKRRPATEQQVTRNDRAIYGEPLGDEPDVGEEIRTTIAVLMPWGISILAHVALIVIAFFLVWQTIVKEEHQPVVPTLSSSPEVSAPTNFEEDPELDTVAGGGAITPDIPTVDPVTITQVGGFEPPAIPKVYDGTGDLDKPYQGPGDDVTPRVIFPPLPKGSANDVVFLIDASGSMVDSLPFVVNELKQVINQTSAKRNATVIFFSGKGVHEVPGGGGVRGLRPMTPAFKTQARQWVTLENFKYHTGGRGSAHVKAAMARALSYKPELVILLSDNLTGGGQGATQHELMQDDLLELIHEHNKARPPAKINTIQFLYEDPLVYQGLEGTLNRIADETGGDFRFISQRDLNLR